MEVFGQFLTTVWEGINIPMNIYGFSFSFRDVFFYSMVGFLIFGFLVRLFNGE